MMVGVVPLLLEMERRDGRLGKDARLTEFLAWNIRYRENYMIQLDYFHPVFDVCKHASSGYIYE
jgi:hypothetical protein